MDKSIIHTKRLLLRRWRESDLPALSAINKDADVMKFIGPFLTDNQTQEMILRAEQSWENYGFGKFAVELVGTGELIGFIGLTQCKFESHFTPAVEIGWRLGNKFWNKGYATEGALAVLGWASDALLLPEIVSFTSRSNNPSRRVMEKIGMHHDFADDFDHPNLKPDNPLRPHVLYRKQ